ncbi:YvcK family protein, partial [Candidatus Acetothermia bacterium]|nr:YvcK family protein [Candidatus Acetothermia bacterium]
MSPRLLRWLHPGIGVKRWVALVVGSACLTVLGLFIALGKDLITEIYRKLLSSFPYQNLITVLAVLLMVLGVVGIVLGVQRALRSIVRGISAEAEGRTGEILYEQRLLKRGPKIVAVGGGTGLPSLLRGLKAYTSNITAIVTTMDDGGSSGRLRRERNMLAPGDIRNNLIALAEDESSIGRLFQHRFAGDVKSSLDGHSLGNLVLAGLQEMNGSFDKAIEELSLILKTRGRVLPSTLDHAELCAQMEDGSVVVGECNIPEVRKRVHRVFLNKEHVKPYPKALEAIRQADIIILGPGSLFTSL